MVECKHDQHLRQTRFIMVYLFLCETRCTQFIGGIWSQQGQAEDSWVVVVGSPRFQIIYINTIIYIVYASYMQKKHM